MHFISFWYLNSKPVDCEIWFIFLYLNGSTCKLLVSRKKMCKYWKIFVSILTYKFTYYICLNVLHCHPSKMSEFESGTNFYILFVQFFTRLCDFSVINPIYNCQYLIVCFNFCRALVKFLNCISIFVESNISRLFHLDNNVLFIGTVQAIFEKALFAFSFFSGLSFLPWLAIHWS